jgi:hypothetical protein
MMESLEFSRQKSRRRYRSPGAVIKRLMLIVLFGSIATAITLRVAALFRSSGINSYN